jgi:SAM-dependent methyltransferase
MLVALPAPFRLERFSKESLAFLEGRFTPRTVFLQIGAADCAFARRAASNVERVYAVDPSGRFLLSAAAPLNLRFLLCDGVRLPLPEATVDLAWGGGFMDQLDPQGAAQHLQSVRRTLVDGGEYLFTTAQPCAIVRRRLLSAGFSAVRISLLSRFVKPLRVSAIK